MVPILQPKIVAYFFLLEQKILQSYSLLGPRIINYVLIKWIDIHEQIPIKLSVSNDAMILNLKYAIIVTMP